MGYIESQLQRLSMDIAEEFAVKVQTRDVNVETHWMNANHGQVVRIMDILAESDTVYTLKAGDVGASHIRAFGQSWAVDGFMGRILPGDVGKRVYKRRDNAGVAWILQVENDAQRDTRVQREKERG